MHSVKPCFKFWILTFSRASDMGYETLLWCWAAPRQPHNHVGKKPITLTSILYPDNRSVFPFFKTVFSKLHEIFNTFFPPKFIYLFIFKHLYWSIIALQWCVSFCCFTKWISYTYTYTPISPPSCISLPPSVSHPSRWSQSTELISLCYAAASH